MKFTKLFQRIYSFLRLIKTHPLAKNEKLSALIRYFTFHLRYKDGEEIAIPFSGGHLIISKGEGSQAHFVVGNLIKSVYGRKRLGSFVCQCNPKELSIKVIFEFNSEGCVDIKGQPEVLFVFHIIL